MTLKEMAAALRSTWGSSVNDDGSTTHDYAQRGPGHDYTFEPIDGGRRGAAVGWGYGIRVGDTLLLVNRANHDGRAAYRVDEISYYADPPDMWQAKLTFIPRLVPALSERGDASPAAPKETA